MTSVLRIGICKIPNKLLLTGLPEVKLFQRGIKGSVLRSISPQPNKPLPYNYREKSYNKLHSIFDKTSRRMDENSKLIVVEGPIAAGKTKFAKEIAEDFGMYHMPEANLDMFYTNAYGYNFKCADDQLPESLRSFDIKDFLCNPKHAQVARLQLMQYLVKFSQYIDALAHLLSTGQGVVLERCVYSDFVFLEALYSQGFVSKKVREYYYEVRDNSLFALKRPHLVIYLDVNVNTVLDRIKKRAIPVEVQSKALTPAYLQTMEDKYKQSYLKKISSHAELLVYDWSEEGDMEVVIEDIERLDFKREDQHDTKVEDWQFEFEEDWYIARNQYSDQKESLMCLLNPGRLDVPELEADAEDCKIYWDLYNNAPGNKYIYGYNPDMGDSVLFKFGARNRETLPLIERKI